MRSSLYRIQIFALILLFTGLIPIACCPDVHDFYQPTSLSSALMVNNEIVPEFTSADSLDEVSITLDFSEVEYLAQQSFTGFSFSAQATKCPHEGMDGMKHHLTALHISSNEDFHDRAAGESLNDYFVPTWDEYVDGEMITQEHDYNELYVYLSQSSYSPSPVNLKMIKQPKRHVLQKLKVTAYFSNGSKLSTYAPAFSMR